MDGRPVISTGVSRGIGRVIAMELAKAGYRLIICARGKEIADVGAECVKLGAKVETMVLDVTSKDAGAKLRDKALSGFGPPWGLVNNAGMAESAPLPKTDDEMFQRHMDLNVLAPFRLMRAIIPRMAERGSGRIINMCSTAALAGYPYVSAYAASKHALLGITRSAAREFAQKGITVNAICPGYVRTEQFKAVIENIAQKTQLAPEEAEAKLRELSPQNRIFDQIEVAHAVKYLLSEEARGVNGQAITIDGGEIEH